MFTIVLSFFGIIIVLNIILYIKYSNIPKSFIPLESKIIRFEERIKWRDATGSPSNPEVSPTYFVPIIEYTFNDKKYIYEGKLPITFATYNFNRKIVLYMNPKKPSDVRHKIKYHWE
ncbi:hypothetical protein D3C87_918670 [compost metagenome]|jgi:hypothetical protein